SRCPQVGPGPRGKFDSRNEFMLHRVMGVKSTRRIPSQAATEEVQESLVVTLQDLAKVLGARSASSTLRGDGDPRLAQGVEEQLPPSALLDEVLLRRTKHFHNAGKLF